MALTNASRSYPMIVNVSARIRTPEGTVTPKPLGGNVKSRLTLAIAAVAAFGLLVGFATNASATPTKTSACSGCHSGHTIAVTANQTSNNGTTATYSVSAPSAYYIAVFDGSTKVAMITGASGTASLTDGHTYTLRAVQGPTTSSGYGQLVVSPVAPAPVPVADTVAPVTTSDALANYVSSAAIHLSAVDNAGGSGVAHTYYVLDGGSQAAGTLVSVGTVGNHTLSFWSVDVAGNVEAAHLVSFAIAAPDPVIPPVVDPVVPPVVDPVIPPVVDPSAMCKITIHVMGANGHVAKSAKVTLVDTVTGAKFTLRTNKSGNASFAHIPYGTYRITAGNSINMATRTITIGKARVKLNLKLHRVHAHEND